MKYYHCVKCGHDSASKSAMMAHAFDEVIVERSTDKSEVSS